MNFFAFFLKSIVAIFAIIGFCLSGAYIAVRLHWTDTKGIVDAQTDLFWENAKAQLSATPFTQDQGDTGSFFNKRNYCVLKAVKIDYRGEFTRILNTALAGDQDLARKNLENLGNALVATNDKKFINAYNSCNSDRNPQDTSETGFKVLADMIDTKTPFLWANSAEWEFFKSGVLKDKEILNKVEKETGVKKRVLVAELMAEQMRLFYSDRPWFKKAIAPLKVLGSMTQFSWGIFGIKPETAMKIEEYLKDEQSAFYIGKQYANMLEFKTANVGQERFNRLTSSDDHYYSYLYAALYNKQLAAQWQKAGYPVSERPEIMATLYNIGFTHSTPNAEPKVGGSDMEIEGTVYSFGGLAKEFYYSKELLDEFPQ